MFPFLTNDGMAVPGAGRDASEALVAEGPGDGAFAALLPQAGAADAAPWTTAWMLAPAATTPAKGLDALMPQPAAAGVAGPASVTPAAGRPAQSLTPATPFPFILQAVAPTPRPPEEPVDVVRPKGPALPDIDATDAMAQPADALPQPAPATALPAHLPDQPWLPPAAVPGIPVAVAPPAPVPVPTDTSGAPPVAMVAPSAQALPAPRITTPMPAPDPGATPQFSGERAEMPPRAAPPAPKEAAGPAARVPNQATGTADVAALPKTDAANPAAAAPAAQARSPLPASSAGPRPRPSADPAPDGAERPAPPARRQDSPDRTPAAAVAAGAAAAVPVTAPSSPPLAETPATDLGTWPAGTGSARALASPTRATMLTLAAETGTPTPAPDTGGVLRVAGRADTETRPAALLPEATVTGAGARAETPSGDTRNAATAPPQTLPVPPGLGAVTLAATSAERPRRPAPHDIEPPESPPRREVSGPSIARSVVEAALAVAARPVAPGPKAGAGDAVKTTDAAGPAGPDGTADGVALGDRFHLPALPDHRPMPHTSAAPPELVRAVSQQLSDAAARFPDRPVELTLAPEELGRVRMTLAVTDAGLTMNVLADRPETLDLLRRHIDQLAQDFRDLGFANLTFSFGKRQDGAPQEQPQPQPPAADPALHDRPAAPQPAAALQAVPARNGSGPAAGLDLRF